MLHESDKFGLLYIHIVPKQRVLLSHNIEIYSVFQTQHGIRDMNINI